MAKKENLKGKKIEELLSNLDSTDTKVKIKAIKSLKVHGNETIIEQLLEELLTTTNAGVKLEIVDLLNTAKSTKVPAKIAKALTEKKFVPIRQVLLTTIWNSGLDYRPYLKEIITVGTEGEMMDAIECITIIENIEGELSEDQLFEPLIVLTEYIGSHKDETGPKMDLLKEITLTLQNRNNML